VPRAITKLTFKALPKGEQAALLGGIAALNSVAAYRSKRIAATADEIEKVAFRNCHVLHKPGKTDYLRVSIEAAGTPASDLHKAYDAAYVAAIVEMGEVLEKLITAKRLPEQGGLFLRLAAKFDADVLVAPARIILTEKGDTEIDMGMRFRTALGLVAWTIVRLSQLRSHVVLRCAECGEFKIASVSKPLRFCSPAHRNAYTVRAFRARAAKTARRHK
jgi:hypothetical protein